MIKYFENISTELKGRRRPRYDDYLFPPELTAEFIGEKFGASRSATLSKLRKMERDDIIVSKKADVEGKPGKRLVFFLKRQLIESRFSSVSEGEKEPGYYGFRELLYEKYSRIFDVQPNGDAVLTVDHHIRNISSKDIIEIPLPKILFDVGKEGEFDNLVRIEIEGQVLPYSSSGLTFYQKSRRGNLRVTEDIIKGPKSHYSEIVYVIPLESPLKPSQNVHIRLITSIPECFSNYADFELAGVQIQEITMSTSLKINAPEGSTIKQLKRYENSSFQNGVIIKDAVTEMRKTELEKELEGPSVRKSTIHWEIDRPVIGYTYAVPFIITKG